MDYLLHVMFMVVIYAVLAVSLDLLVGHTGLLPISHAASFVIGAYSSALLTTRLGMPFGAGICLGMVVAALASVLVSVSSLRVHGDYFVVTTFAFQAILFDVLNNWVAVTRGPLGVYGIPQPMVLGKQDNSHLGLLVLALTLCAVAHIVVYRISTSPFGRVLHAIREDEVFARTLGKCTLRFKVQAFAVSASLAAAAGSLYAHHISYVCPTNLTVAESVLVISMVIIGGAGSVWGPALGAGVLVTLPEMLRFVGVPGPAAGNVQQIIYGGLLVGAMLLRPRGLVGRYGFER